MVEKYTLMNCRAYTEKLIELVKAGKTIDMNLTNSMFGRFYTIVVKSDEVEAKSAEPEQQEAVVAEKATNVVEEATEAVEPQQAEAKPAARGRKAK